MRVTVNLIIAALLFVAALFGWISVWWAVGAFALDILGRVLVSTGLLRRAINHIHSDMNRG